MLTNGGFGLYALDASDKLITAFGTVLQGSRGMSAVEESEFLRTSDGVVAWGLIFLLPAEVQPLVIGKVGRALSPAGKFLFTSPREALTWPDALTGRKSVSLGGEAYQRILRAEGLILVGETFDEGDNHYYFASKVSERV